MARLTFSGLLQASIRRWQADHIPLTRSFTPKQADAVMIRLSKRVGEVAGRVVRRTAEREGGQAGLPAKTSSLVN